MSPLFFGLLGVSFAGLLVLFIYQFLKTRRGRRLWLQILLLVLAAVAIVGLFGAPGGIQAKGSDSGFVVVLYLCMMLGMLAHAAYIRFEQPKARRPPFEWGAFLAPLFASPIIFIPLLAALQNANVDLAQLTAPRLMVFFVAFENGFFWKEYFDHRREGQKQGADG